MKRLSIYLSTDKGRGVVIVNKTDYVSKSLEFFEGENFCKISDDPTAKFQKTAQNKLYKTKKKFDRKTYNRLYPSGSQPGLCFGMAKYISLETQLMW